MLAISVSMTFTCVNKARGYLNSEFSVGGVVARDVVLDTVDDIVVESVFITGVGIVSAVVEMVVVFVVCVVVLILKEYSGQT